MVPLERSEADDIGAGSLPTVSRNVISLGSTDQVGADKCL